MSRGGFYIDKDSGKNVEFIDNHLVSADPEADELLTMSDEDLDARFDNGTPARIARREPWRIKRRRTHRLKDTREIAELEAEVERWKNIAESRLGTSRRNLRDFRRTLPAARANERHVKEIRRLTRERDALKALLPLDEALRAIRALKDTK